MSDQLYNFFWSRKETDFCTVAGLSRQLGLIFQNTFVQPILVQKDGKPFQEDRNLWKSTAVLVSLSSPTKFLI